MIEHNFPLALSYDDVLLLPQYSEINSRSDIDLTTKIAKNIEIKIPLITINMDCVTGVEMAIEIGKMGGLGILPRFDTAEIQAEKVAQVKKSGVLTCAAIGIKEGFIKRAEMLVNAGADLLTIDVAHGHLQKTLDATKDLKNKFGENFPIISGVVGTYEGAKALFEAGADSVRVGVGPGTICTTRIMTGHGVPQISALIEAKRAAVECGKYIISDGGAVNSGDIVKALACGACAQISGSIYAGTEESPGKKVDVNGKIYKEYNASTSVKEKMNQISKNSEDKGANYVIHTEGIESLVEYTGKLENVIEGLLAGIRSGFSYSGAFNIQELWEKAKFIRVTSAGREESNFHDIQKVS